MFCRKSLFTSNFFRWFWSFSQNWYRCQSSSYIWVLSYHGRMVLPGLLLMTFWACFLIQLRTICPGWETVPCGMSLPTSIINTRWRKHIIDLHTGQPYGGILFSIFLFPKDYFLCQVDIRLHKITSLLSGPISSAREICYSLNFVNEGKSGYYNMWPLY